MGISLMMITVFGLFAQQKAGKGQGGERPNFELMAKELNLNSEQSAKVKEIMKNSFSSIKEARSSDVTREEKKQKVMAIIQNQDNQMRAVLNTEQYSKYQGIKEERMNERHQDRAENRPKLTKEQKQLLKAKRMSFDNQLSQDEKRTLSTIRLERNALQEKMKGIKDNKEMDQAQKDQYKSMAKEKHREWMDKTQVIARNHRSELDKIGQDIQSAIGAKGDRIKVKDHKNPSMQKPTKENKKTELDRPSPKDRMEHRFLLMDIAQDN